MWSLLLCIAVVFAAIGIAHVIWLESDRRATITVGRTQAAKALKHIFDNDDKIKAARETLWYTEPILEEAEPRDSDTVALLDKLDDQKFRCCIQSLVDFKIAACTDDKVWYDVVTVVQAVVLKAGHNESQNAATNNGSGRPGSN